MRSWPGAAALADTPFGALLCLLEAIGFAIDGDDFGVVDETINQRDDACGVGEYLAPLGERAVGGDQRARALIAPEDPFEHQIGLGVRVGEGTDFVDRRELRTQSVAQAAALGGITIGCREIAEP